jgi:hypothetical protein
MVLLSDGRLQEVDSSAGRVVRGVKLPDKPVEFPSHSLAAGPGGIVFALTRGHVYTISVASLSVVATTEAPPGATAISVGPASGDVYVGSKDTLTVLDGRSLRPHGAPSRASSSYEVAVTPDEARLYAGGHDNGFVQEFEINRTSIAAGRQLRNHGGFVPLAGGGLLTGDGEGGLLLYAPTGTQPKQADTTLGGHQMELAASGSTAVVLGSCLYLGGLALVDLNSMAVRVVVPRHQPAGQPRAGQDSVCGERYLLMGDSVAAIRPSGLAVMSQTSGRVMSFVPLDGALDLVLRPH